MDIEIRITNPAAQPDCLPIIHRALERKHPHLTAEEAESLWEKLKQANRPKEFGSYLNCIGWNSFAGKELRKSLQTYLKGKGIVVIPRSDKETGPVTASHVVGLKRVDAVARKVRLNKKLKDLRENLALESGVQRM
jgi:hypothetical protein